LTFLCGSQSLLVNNGNIVGAFSDGERDALSAQLLPLARNIYKLLDRDAALAPTTVPVPERQATASAVSEVNGFGLTHRLAPSAVCAASAAAAPAPTCCSSSLLPSASRPVPAAPKEILLLLCEKLISDCIKQHHRFNDK